MDIATQVVVTSGGVLTAFIIAYFQYKSKKLEYSKLEQKHLDLVKENKRLNIERASLTVLFDYEFYNFLETEIDKIFKTTKCDSFCIHFAINGKSDFNYTTVAFEMTRTESNNSAIARYIRVVIDDDYRKMLKDAEKNSEVTLDIDSMQDNLLKRIYQSDQERIKFSIVRFLARIPVDDDNDVLLYSTSSTHDIKGYTATEKTQIQITHDALRSRMQNIVINEKK